MHIEMAKEADEQWKKEANDGVKLTVSFGVFAINLILYYSCTKLQIDCTMVVLVPFLTPITLTISRF